MAKAKIYARQKRSYQSGSKKKQQNEILTLKKGVRIRRYDPLKTLLDEDLLAQAIWECLKDDEPEMIVEIIEAHLGALAINKADLAKKAGVAKTTIYHSFKRQNPTLKTLAKIVHAATS